MSIADNKTQSNNQLHTIGESSSQGIYILSSQNRIFFGVVYDTNKRNLELLLSGILIVGNCVHHAYLLAINGNSAISFSQSMVGYANIWKVAFMGKW